MPSRPSQADVDPAQQRRDGEPLGGRLQGVQHLTDFLARRKALSMK